MTLTTAPTSSGTGHDRALRAVEDRVLWLATAIVDHANRVRPNPAGLKVGGHQASSASIVTIMTALWLEQLTAQDRVSVKPHASPVLHALEYLLGQLDAKYLTTLREFGGLQSYPSRLKNPVPADYSTGSVGIGATAPIWGAIARRYVGTQFGTRDTGRQWSLVGDAELDEGAVWEAVLDPMAAELGEVVWIVDLNRQSLDRVLPTMGGTRLQGMFTAAGWQVLTVKYGRLLQELFTRPGGSALRDRIDEMPNAEYQRLLRRTPADIRAVLPGDGPAAADIAALIAEVPDAGLAAAVRNLGGHDLATLREAFEQIDDSRPTVILAYTLKGYGLATEGHPQNHSALLSEAQLRDLAARLGADPADPWAVFEAGSPAAALLADAARRLRRPAPDAVAVPPVPGDLGRTPSGTAATQAALGRTLLDLNRATPEVGRRVVTVSPDVSSSTNLGGWVNKVGVWSHEDRRNWFADDTETILHWREKPTGQHIELGIAETNLVGAISELGATWSRWGQPLLPIGVLYDPFVERALEPWSFGIYAGGQSILVGTPSGVTLAPEGGAHQSITTPSIGLEQPGCVSYEPAFTLDTEWCLLAALAQLGRPGGSSAYLRLSTRPVDQTLAAIPTDPAARERRRRHVVAGAYTLRRVPQPVITLVAMGAVVPEVLAAAERLDGLGLRADVVVVTSPGLLFQALQARRGLDEGPTWVLDSVFPAGRATPMVTVLDGHPHAGFPQRRPQRPGRPPGRDPVWPERRPRQRLPIPRPRHRDHRRHRPRPRRLSAATPSQPGPAARTRTTQRSTAWTRLPALRSSGRGPARHHRGPAPLRQSGRRTGRRAVRLIGYRTAAGIRIAALAGDGQRSRASESSATRSRIGAGPSVDDSTGQRTVHVTRNGAGVPFTPGPDHHGVTPQRLHGREAGETDRLVATRSEFAAGASVEAGPVSGETVYVLLAGALIVSAAGQKVTLTAGDSIHLPDGTVRGLQCGSSPASVLVVRVQ